MFFWAILFHYGFIFVVVIYLYSQYLYKRPYVAIIITLILISSFEFFIANTRYMDYDNFYFKEEFSPISAKNIYIFFTSLAIYFYTFIFINNKFEKKRLLSLSLSNLCILLFTSYIGLNYASIAMRYADILLFLCFFSLAWVPRNKVFDTYKVITIVIFVPFYVYTYFYSINKLFSLASFMRIFTW